MLREIKGTQRLPRMLALKLTGTGTAALGQGSTDATLVDNGTGDYSLTWAKQFTRPPVVVVSSKTAATHIELATVSESTLRIKTFAMDGTTAQDAVLEILALGWDAADQY